MEATRRTEVVIIGAGIVGAAAAWQLSQRGIDVALLEQFDLDHRRGSSHGVSRIFRLAYDRVEYVRLAQRALPLWREAESSLGEELLWTTGGLDIGPPEALGPIEAALTAAGASSTRLARDRDESDILIPSGWEALYQADTGVLRADVAVRGLRELAERSGAQVRDHTFVERVDEEADGVTIRTSRGEWRASRVVITAGGWANRLLEPLGLTIPLRVTREHVAYFGARGPFRTPFIWHDPRGPYEMYGLPNGSVHEVKVGEHGASPVTDPDQEGEVEHARLEPVEGFAARHLPTLERPARGYETCIYAATPDDHFVLDRRGLMIIGVGLGGHGFKFGVVLGVMLADLVEDGEPEEMFALRWADPR